MRSIKIRHILVFLLTVFLFTAGVIISPVETEAASPCPSGSFTTVFWNSINTLHNIFPIKIAGMTILNFKGHEDFDDSAANIICICKAPPPLFLRIGIPLHMWEPVDIIETVQHPWCSPTIGTQLGISYSKDSLGGENEITTTNNQNASVQVHLIKYPIWGFLGLFIDFVCFQATGLDFLYVTEIDPLWQNDLWSAILTPEGSLFANKALQLACPIDAVAATAGFPINYLFWCAGSWGSSYPFSKNMPSVDYLQGNAGLSAKFIAKMHRELVLWQTTGSMMLRGYCTAFPNPVWKKTQYNLVLLYPTATTNRQPVGRSTLLWAVNKNVPMRGSDFVWMMYRARDCCAF